MKTILTQSESGVVWNAKGDIQSLGEWNQYQASPPEEYTLYWNENVSNLYDAAMSLTFNTDGTFTVPDYHSQAGSHSQATRSGYDGDWVDTSIVGSPPTWGEDLGGANYTLHWPTPTIVGDFTQVGAQCAAADSQALSSSVIFNASVDGASTILWTGCYIINEATGTQINDGTLFNIRLVIAVVSA